MPLSTRLQDGLVVADFEMKILLINHVAEEIFDTKSEDIVGSNLTDIIDINLLSEVEKGPEENPKFSKFDFVRKGKIFNANISSVWGSSGLVWSAPRILVQN